MKMTTKQYRHLSEISCPNCGERKLRLEPVKGEYGVYDTKKAYCQSCFRHYDTDDLKIGLVVKNQNSTSYVNKHSVI